jgi:RNase P subunit RPR2
MRTNAEAECPKCATPLTAALGITAKQAMPREGDYSICAYCHAPLTYRADLTLRLATESELVELRALLKQGAERK